MPVIGRLDGQVEDVIISPISNRQRADESDEKTNPSHDSTKPAPHASTQTLPTDESSAKPDELPVWLL